MDSEGSHRVFCKVVHSWSDRQGHLSSSIWDGTRGRGYLDQSTVQLGDVETRIQVDGTLEIGHPMELHAWELRNVLCFLDCQSSNNLDCYSSKQKLDIL